MNLRKQFIIKAKKKLDILLSAAGRNISALFSFTKKDKAGKEKEHIKEQIEMDRKLVYSLSKSRVPSLRQIKYIKRFLTRKELWALRLSFLTILISSIFWTGSFYARNLKTVPVKGGTYVEALIGAPQYINPLYSGISDVDNDISSLVFSSLFKRGKSSELKNDLVQSYSVSRDGRAYDFKIIENARWHDGRPLTVNDIIFTFNAIVNSQYKSNLRPSFMGVKIEKKDDHNFSFILSDPYAAFLDLLTFGILPSHYWQEIPADSAPLAELNLKPIGSGAYKFKELAKDRLGTIKEYDLEVNEDYYGPKPLVDLDFRFFSNFSEAVASLNNQQIDGISYLPQDLKESILTPKSYNMEKLFLPQLTLMYINQSRNEVLADKAVRQALALAIDKNAIINDILKGDAYSIHGPILPNNFAYNPDIEKYEYDLEAAGKKLDNIDWIMEEISEEQINEARADLESEDEEKAAQAQELLSMGKGKWRKKDGRYLVIDLKTVDRNENEEILRYIKDFWERIGIKTNYEILSIAEIQSQVIKPRNFDVLFYGQVLGADPDPYAFWHSSQTGENGFNIANFANKEVDRILEDARLVSDQAQRQELYREFQSIIAEEIPAIYMYSPVYTYIQSKNLKGFDVKNILLPKDRFSNIEEWYLKTGKRLVIE